MVSRGHAGYAAAAFIILELVGSNSWKIARYISFMVIIALFVLKVIPRSNRSNERTILEKSIAVLPDSIQLSQKSVNNLLRIPVILQSG